MSWSKIYSTRTYHEWRIESQRQIAGKRVHADAIVAAASGDSDAPANWEILHDGSPVARGHASSVKQAKKDAFAALWKPRQLRFARKVR